MAVEGCVGSVDGCFVYATDISDEHLHHKVWKRQRPYISSSGASLDVLPEGTGEEREALKIKASEPSK